MRLLLSVFSVILLAGCASSAPNRHLNEAYQAYEQGDCAAVIYQLSQAERTARSRPYLQPEISLLRGLCLERQGLYLDAIQIYRHLLRYSPTSEYAYRAGARLETLRQLGHYDPEQPLAPERR